MDATHLHRAQLSDGYISIRPATLCDGDRLLAWRNDRLTRRASRHRDPISAQAHDRWLRNTLADDSRQLSIVEIAGCPVGMVRVDEGPPCELSWTVAPAARGRGIGSRMVSLIADSLPRAFYAHVREENTSSIRIAQKAGMIEVRRQDGFIIFGKNPYQSQSTSI